MDEISIKGEPEGKRPRLAVFIPAYNAEKTLARAIASLDKEIEPHDIVIFDDASSAPVADCVKPARNLTILRSERNVGVSRASNIGLRYMRRKGYELVARLDADDENLPDRLGIQRRFLDENGGVGLVGGRAQVVSEKGEKLFVINHPTEHEDILRKLYYNSAFAHPSVMFRLKTVLDASGYDESFDNAEDYELMRRLSTKTRLANLPTPLINYTVSSSSLSVKSRGRQVRSRLRVQWMFRDFKTPHFYLGMAKTLLLMMMPLRIVNALKSALRGLAGAFFVKAALLFVLSIFAFAMPETAGAGAMPDGRIGSGFGVNVKPERLSDEDLDRIKAMGFGFVRFDLRWREVEYMRGTYNWDWFDKFIGKLRERGIKSLIIVHGGNAVYTGMVDLPPSQAFGYRNAPAAPFNDEHIQAFVKFATSTVARYGTEDVVWEIWNEPDIAGFWPPKPDATAFVRLATAVCDSIRKNSPDATIVGPALAHMPNLLDNVRIGFMESVLASTLSTCLDAISIHPYRSKDQAPETAAIDYEKKVRAFIAARTPAGQKPLPIVSSEWGYTTTRASEQQQGAYVLRTHLTNLLNGVPLSIWYEWRDSRQGKEDPEAHFGILRSDGSDKPASEALDGLLPKIKDATIEKRVPVAGEADCYALIIRQPDGRRQMLAWMGKSSLDYVPVLRLKFGQQDGGEHRLSLTPVLFDLPSPSAPDLSLAKQ